MRNYISLFFMIFVFKITFGQNYPYIKLKEESFVEFDNNWTIVGDVLWDYEESEFEKLIPGQGVFVNRPSREFYGHLVTKDSFSDLEIEFDFMMYKSSNSGIYLMGRYEVQLFDSWMVDRPSFSDCGGVYQRWDENKNEDKGYEGVPPLINACKAPGLWQNMKIYFKAPKFDSTGKKVQNARFEKVFLNGVLVQDQVEVTGATRAAYFSDEKEEGPLMIQGDHGKIALRNIKYKSLKLTDTMIQNRWVVEPIEIESDGFPYVLRSFVKYEDEKLPYAVSVGTPEKMNYTYDTNQGSLIQLWRGGFMDVTDMWFRRGEPQTASPLGANLILSKKPDYAVLDKNVKLDEWPSLYSSKNLEVKGYTLDKKGYPIFAYDLNGTIVHDCITPLKDKKGLQREISTPNQSKNHVVRAAIGYNIIKIRERLYRVDGEYYINLPENSLVNLVNREGEDELQLKAVGSNTLIKYDIVW